MRRFQHGSVSLLTSLQLSQRWLHVPPGGFVDPLPPTFGRQSGRGRMSNANLRMREINAKKLAKSKKKLVIPTPSSGKLKKKKPGKQSSISLETVKKELEALIGQSEKYNACYRPPSQLPDKTKIDPAAEKEEDVPAYLADAPKEEFSKLSKQVSEEDSDHQFEESIRQAAMTAAPTTLLDDYTRQEGALTPRATPRNVNDGDTWESEMELEKRYSVTPNATVFGSDLDRLEREMIREYQQYTSTLPPLDPVYSQFGGGIKGKRMRWEPSSSFDKLRPEDMKRNYRDEKIVGVDGYRNVSAYHMEAEAYRERMEHDRRVGQKGQNQGKGINFTKTVGKEEEEDVEVTEEAPEEENPHFPTAAEDLVHQTSDIYGHRQRVADDRYYFDKERIITVNAKTDYKNKLVVTDEANDTDEANLYYDAYVQRPGEQRLLELRGADYWGSYENRKKLEKHELAHEERVRQEVLQEGAVDTSLREYSAHQIRKETFLYFKAHPINEMIQEPYVRIRQVLPKGGGVGLQYNPMLQESTEGVDPSLHETVHLLNADVDIPLQEARRMAQNLGLDLIRTGCVYTEKSDRRVIALCTIADHREHLRDMLRFKIQKLGVQPPPSKECIEVLFRGATHPHGIRFKSIGIAKHILHRHAVRINLMKFGTPREGFPVLQTILDEVRKQCMRLKAHHTVGEIQSNYNEIFCYLYPSTPKSPKTTVEHPTPAQVREAQEFHTLQTEKEIFFDDLQNKVTQKERLAYMLKMEKGEAWADKDEGMSLQKQRAIKVRLGYLPKGNKEIYAARGDVNIPAPFRASHATTTERWSHPRESNLEQASRGAAVLGKRASMSISDMHDAGETPENPSQLDRFYYRVQGPALEVGELKEAFGLKDNRRKQPGLAPGFATLGMEEYKRDNGTATK
ncbi:hypothetical protein AGDE_06074 [Angomonas deanei]|uniref:Uncharacterized protein n=1 Tax=Angomonas deanei TaxID=59799 RepID=A0A7G2CCS3_9TRYP|nr:hypothetical protein AGDE_06074 [Angomonas deanei]CAD2217628.1 hypothetical protein, conserved [Angomonas deanei]|eukprot:EPY37859.1 hypothetical protein AGDE_06074 [Angomonas deanei]